MKRTIIHVGLDVDDSAYHGCAFDQSTGELVRFSCRPTLKGLVDKLKKLKARFSGVELTMCYEASYVGFSLQRDLDKAGYACDVVAPSSIPNPRGKQVKTDRIDAQKLAQFYASGLLTIVTPPDEEVEQDRDLLRSRQYVLRQLANTRTHLQSLMRRNGLHYKAQTGAKSHWTHQHYSWLKATAQRCTGSLKINIELHLRQIAQMEDTLRCYEDHVDVLAQTPRYQDAVRALTCYKGIKNIFALTMITEIGNVARFSHPRQLVSWMGLDVREYSSGGKRNQFGITRHGNRYLRTAFIEANQRGYRSRTISLELRSRRKDTPTKFVDIADRCLSRVSKKGNRLLHAGKHPNKVKVACAREMVGFVWESLKAAA